ncbi:MAG: hypothetical protein KKA79_03500 [Nanoarchaeota archaeon]|nr:hypothetical protein [Nanoarchaeota archaeon]MCG2718251.1 hypothetical protein [Nanoarchaeota archaeon]
MKLSKKKLDVPELNHRSSWLKKLLYLIIIAAIIYGIFHYGFIKKNCERDEECFSESAKTCWPTKLINVKNGNYYDYAIKGKRGEDCLIYVKLDKIAPGTPIDMKGQFEGKDMHCRVPLAELETTDFKELKGFMQYCHGELKEAIYEQIITKMYGLVIQNLDEIIEAGTEAIS